MDESHFEHTGEILGGFLKSREDASAFFQPADQSLDDVSLAICFSIERNRTDISVVTFLAGNDRRDFQFQETSVDPIGSVRFIASQSNRPGHRLPFAIENRGIRAVE